MEYLNICTILYWLICLIKGWESGNTAQTYSDVVSGPVDAADGQAHTPYAALVHVAGNGAAEARQAEHSAEA